METDYKAKINKLKTFFMITNAAFDMQSVVISAFGKEHNPSEMRQLHKMALDEISKNKPDLKIMDYLLSEMEKRAEK